GHIVYVEGEARLAAAEASPTLAIIVSADVKGSRRKPLLRVANPRLAFARALRLLHPIPRMPPGIASSAHIGSAVALAQQV
ncbi:MAG: hypothetical protein GTN79_03220, partial [Gammaproteobacteria bacterium]|nr:hypothetical protein [Gammaproteobacteria bacterium]